MRLLDAGCGPGSITLGLAAAVAPGLVSGVDVDASALDAARKSAREAACENAEFREASVFALPFESATFDAVFCHAVLQHLPEPAAALAEFARVLRPGGVIGLADADYDGSLIWPRPEGLSRALDLQDAVRQRAGGDPRIGRRLGGLLDDAGFVDIAFSATATCEGTSEATGRTAEFSARYLEAPAFHERAAALGLATPGDLATMAPAWREWGSTPGAMWARFWCNAIGRKPG
jgi:SAM-dependent methyltransferase